MTLNSLPYVKLLRQHIWPQLKNFFPRLLVHSKILINQKSSGLLSAQWNNSLTDLRKYGVAKLPASLLSSELTSSLSSLMKEKKYDEVLGYFNKLCGYYPNHNYEIDISGKSVVPIQVPLDKRIFSEKFLYHLHALLSSYYNQSYWLRNEPILALDVNDKRLVNDKTDQFHIDYAFHQTTLVVLLNDLSQSSTTTEIIKRSHLFPHLFFEMVYKNKLRFSFLSKFITKRMSNKYGQSKITGTAGECFIFDPGNAFHRASWGSDRLMLHFTFAVSTPHLTAGYIDHLSQFGSLYTNDKLTADSLF